MKKTYKIDVDLTNGLADYIGAASVVSGTSTINIDDINFVGISSGRGRMKVADTVLKDRIRLSSAYDDYTWEGEEGITYRLKGYSIEVDETDGKEYGYLISSFNRIHDAVHASHSERYYEIFSDIVNSSGNEVVTQDLGLIGGGAGASLTIDGGAGRYGVDGNGHQGIVVGAEQSLT